MCPMTDGSSVHRESRPTPSGPLARPRVLSSVVLAVVVVVASFTLGLVFLSGPPGPRTVVLGPYVLNNTTTFVGLSFPNCSIVTAHWHVVTGSTGNFTVRPPALIGNVVCSDYVPPSNATCPPGDCSPYGSAPVCYEQGTGGNCTFTSTAKAYSFALYDQGVLQSLGLLIVSFTVVYVTAPSGQ
jgi:hypothetical protein